MDRFGQSRGVFFSIALLYCAICLSATALPYILPFDSLCMHGTLSSCTTVDRLSDTLSIFFAAIFEIFWRGIVHCRICFSTIFYFVFYGHRIAAFYLNLFSSVLSWFFVVVSTCEVVTMVSFVVLCRCLSLLLLDFFLVCLCLSCGLHLHLSHSIRLWATTKLCSATIPVM